MYNLAHVYIYDETIKQDLNKSIDLLLRSMDKFEHSFILLCLALLLKFEFNVETIKQELSIRNDITEMIIDKILAVIGQYKLYFNELYELYRHKDYLYNITLHPILSSELEHIDKKAIKPKYPNAKDLSPEFYAGFGY
ncbi:hypothetical protein M9Y10_035902 [Tritrichomonas musculus]|uniref:Uncharacterized protein n=1 Tax=Tritrichomonas musculus TaxID=1915356 RepID=A0ABR2GVJ7_9EUKA